jgi:toxin ParE1/3/4
VTFEVRILPEAEQDMTEAASWYEQQQRGLGREFLDEALAVFMRFAETPLAYEMVHRSARRS